MNKAQTAVEYIIIIAVVIIMAIIVVGVIGGVPNLGSGSEQNTINLAASQKKVGVADFSITPAGARFSLVNNLPWDARIQGIWIDAEKVVPKNGYPIFFAMGQKKDIEVYAGIPEANTKSVSIDMQYSHAKTGASYFINDTEVRFSLPATYFQKDLVALYHFEENSYSGAADEVVDSSGNGYHGFAVSGATTSNTGKMGRALFVDESYVNSSIIVPASDFSVSMWYRIDNTLLTDGPGPAGMTLLEGTVDDGGSGLFYIDLDETGPWMYSIAGVNFFDGAATESLAADYVETATHDQWYHFAAVRDNATHITLYRNGVEVGTGTNQNVGYYTISNIVLGSASDGFIGYIDEVAIWSRALSADDIESIYQYGN